MMTEIKYGGFQRMIFSLSGRRQREKNGNAYEAALLMASCNSLCDISPRMKFRLLLSLVLVLPTKNAGVPLIFISRAMAYVDWISFLTLLPCMSFFNLLTSRPIDLAISRMLPSVSVMSVVSKA